MKKVRLLCFWSMPQIRPNLAHAKCLNKRVFVQTLNPKYQQCILRAQTKLRPQNVNSLCVATIDSGMNYSFRWEKCHVHVIWDGQVSMISSCYLVNGELTIVWLQSKYITIKWAFKYLEWQILADVRHPCFHFSGTFVLFRAKFIYIGYILRIEYFRKHQSFPSRNYHLDVKDGSQQQAW